MSDQVTAAVRDPEREVQGNAQQTGSDEDGVLCAVCSSKRLGDSPRSVNGRRACASCLEQAEAELAAQRPTLAAYVTATGAGLIGVLLGAVAWAALSVATESEAGYGALLVGALGGLGVRLGACGARSGNLQLLAVGLSLFGMLVAKYAWISYQYVGFAKGNGVELSYFDPMFRRNFVDYLVAKSNALDLLCFAVAVVAAFQIPKRASVTIT